MSCFRPSMGWISYFKDDEQTILREHPKTYIQGSWIGHNENGQNTFQSRYYLDARTGEMRHPFKVPCRKCAGCLQDESRQWSLRCFLESQSSENNYFVTLTYDDLYLPEPDGENQEAPPLVKKHLQDFMKRLRRHFEYHYGFQGVRMFAGAEYGTKNHRPHFHVLLFNAPLGAGLWLWKVTEHGDNLYRSSDIEDCWTFGFSTVGILNYHTVCYTTCYTFKKLECTDTGVSYAENMGIPEPFHLQSNKPGIGFDYFEKHWQDLYKDPSSSRIQMPDGFLAFPPKYFDNKVGELDPVLAEGMKSFKARVGYLSEKATFKATSLSEHEYFKVKEENLDNNLKKLLRSIE